MSQTLAPRRIPAWVPIRYTTFTVALLGTGLFFAAARLWGGGWWWVGYAICLALSVLGVWDMLQTRHAILRNYPIIGHFRFMLEYIRPEIRQYFIESDQEALPFSRAQRSLVYQRAKGESDSRPLGTLLNVTAQGYEWVNHSMQPTKLTSHDFRIWIGGTPDEAQQGADP